jgi:hypothetical protein
MTIRMAMMRKVVAKWKAHEKYSAASCSDIIRIPSRILSSVRRTTKNSKVFPTFATTKKILGKSHLFRRRACAPRWKPDRGWRSPAGRYHHPRHHHRCKGPHCHDHLIAHPHPLFKDPSQSSYSSHSSPSSPTSRSIPPPRPHHEPKTRNAP